MTIDFEDLLDGDQSADENLETPEPILDKMPMRPQSNAIMAAGDLDKSGRMSAMSRRMLKL